MFKSGILNIRKVQSESNIKFFEYFGQPTSTLLQVNLKKYAKSLHYPNFSTLIKKAQASDLAIFWGVWCQIEDIYCYYRLVNRA